MNTIRKNVLIALAALATGAAAIGVQAQSPAQGQAPTQTQAQGGPGHHGAAMTPEQRQARHAERMAQRQAKLHDLLKLTPAQEPAWAAYVAASKPLAAPTQADRQAWSSLSAPARLEKRIALQKQHIAVMESHLAALKTFYAQLTPEQKKLFDQHAQHHGGYGRGGHRGHGMHGMHGMKG
ncbi:MAG TPA: Spy/CpxP family protein refolding chaperone [Telluria sp.]